VVQIYEFLLYILFLLYNNDYESLQKFIECVFAQQGKWKSAGGTSIKFVSSIADLSCTWYPGKLNSLLFHGKTGDLVNVILVTVCILSQHRLIFLKTA
jgi:hypothetical protein